MILPAPSILPRLDAPMPMGSVSLSVRAFVLGKPKFAFSSVRSINPNFVTCLPYAFYRLPVSRLRRSSFLLASNVSDLSNNENTEEDEFLVKELKVPEYWMIPSNALKEAEWLRVTLHKWLDDEYCPEDANIEISKVAAQSYYNSLIAKTDELGEILMNMVKALQNVSFQESFHGVFSSANAAVHLITSKIESTEQY